LAQAATIRHSQTIAVLSFSASLFIYEQLSSLAL
jgi:hypothetical protein